MEDVVILGGGPAGCGAARLLATWGHSVLLLTRGASRGPLAESIPPSCRKLFDAIGITAVIEQAGFVRAAGNTIRWGSEQRVVNFPAGTWGWQVDRARFDALLLGAALAAGAEVRADVTVRSVSPDRDHSTVRFDGAAGSEHIEARWVLDCTGRTGLLARQWRQPEPARRTVALLGRWSCTQPWDLPDYTHTLVESYAGGWTWSVPFSERDRCIAVMVDPALAGLRGRELLDAYRAELQKTARLWPLLERAELIGAPWACDASPYYSTCVAAERTLTVGDAVSFVDPLSSFGVKKALASAWLAAVVTHSCLDDETVRPAALQLYEGRERIMYQSLMRQAAGFLQRAAAGHADEFWQERAETDALDRPGEPDVAALRDDPDVLRAFAQLKQASAIQLRVSDTVAYVELPVVRGNRITLATHLRCDAFPEGIRYLRDVDLLQLMLLAPQARQVPDLFDAYNRSAPPVALPDFLGALSTLLARRLLLHA